MGLGRWLRSYGEADERERFLIRALTAYVCQPLAPGAERVTRLLERASALSNMQQSQVDTLLGVMLDRGKPLLRLLRQRLREGGGNPDFQELLLKDPLFRFSLEELGQSLRELPGLIGFLHEDLSQILAEVEGDQRPEAPDSPSRELLHELRSLFHELRLGPQLRIRDLFCLRSERDGQRITELLKSARKLPATVRQHPELLTELGHLQYVRDKPQHAAEAFVHALEESREPARRAVCGLNAFSALVQAGEAEAAIDHYQRAIEEDPGCALVDPQRYRILSVDAAEPCGLRLRCAHVGRERWVHALEGGELAAETVFAQLEQLNACRVEGLAQVVDLSWAEPRHRRGGCVGWAPRPGPDLASWLHARGPLDPKAAVALLLQLAKGLQAAHNLGIWHRHLRPENVVYDGSQAQLIGFGLAPRAPDLHHYLPQRGEGRSLLVEGMRKALPFAAPEQKGELEVEADGRCDIYSLGQLGFFALFQSLRPQPAAITGLEGVCGLLERCRAQKPDARPSGWGALIGELQELSAHPGRRTMPVGRDLFPELSLEAAPASDPSDWEESGDTEPELPPVLLAGLSLGVETVTPEPVDESDESIGLLSDELSVGRPPALKAPEPLVDSEAPTLIEAAPVSYFLDSDDNISVSDSVEVLVPRVLHNPTSPEAVRAAAQPAPAPAEPEPSESGEAEMRRITRRSASTLSQLLAAAKNQESGDALRFVPEAPPDLVVRREANRPRIEPQEVSELWWNPSWEQAEVAAVFEVPVAITNSQQLDFVLVPPGSFSMGSSPVHPDHQPDERQHNVEITRPFYLGATPISQRDWERVMGSNPAYLTNAGPDAPVETVSWWECLKLCNRLSELEGLEPAYTLEITREGQRRAWFQGLDGEGYRLPTEAEWELACRAESASAFCFGPGLAPEQANFGGTLRHTAPVRSYPANAWGLFDMHGNVWEWCWDWYGIYPPHDCCDPLGPEGGSKRVVRGGGWNFAARACRSAKRYSENPDFSYNALGVRVLRPVLPPNSEGS